MSSSSAIIELYLTARHCAYSYRFRLINIACDPNYNFTIAGHSMTIIEADGQNSEPLVVDELQIFVAQRYSFVVSLASHYPHLFMAYS